MNKALDEAKDEFKLTSINDLYRYKIYVPITDVPPLVFGLVGFGFLLCYILKIFGVV